MQCPFCIEFIHHVEPFLKTEYCDSQKIIHIVVFHHELKESFVNHKVSFVKIKESFVNVKIRFIKVK